MTMRATTVAVWALLGTMAPFAGAQEKPGTPPLKVERAASKITLDGTLDEEAWGSAFAALM